MPVPITPVLHDRPERKPFSHMTQHPRSFQDLLARARSTVREVTIDQTIARLKQNPDVQLVDIREDDEWAAGHIAGAQHIGKGVIERDIETKIPDRNAEIILYCGGGSRSLLAGQTLQEMGYTNVASMTGGWREWRARGEPTEGP